MVRALILAACLAPLCALLGVFVTARRMAFFSDTISHAALAGVALGAWLGFVEPSIPIVLTSIAVAALVLWLKEKTTLLTDTILAILLSGSVAFGIILLSLLNIRPGDIHGFLFGDILAVGPREVWQAGGLFLIVGLGVFTKLSQLSLITAHEELARICGIPVGRLNYLFVLVLTLTVALTIQLLGIILVTSLLVIPPAAAQNLSRSLRQQILLSLLFGLTGGVGGLLLSYPLNTPCGPTIVLTSIALFTGSLILSLLRSKLRLAPVPTASPPPAQP
jgi:ABC-type Mn2+/Zn2+ transport system permease subunit